MRWVSCLLVAMVLLVGPAAAEEEPKGDAAPTIESEAERVRTAAKAKDTAQLKDIADNGAFGPWMLVEHLLGAGHADAAAAFAEQTEDSTALAAYITAQRDRKPNLAQRELLDAVHGHLDGSAWKDAVTATEAVAKAPTDGAALTVTLLRLRCCRAEALEALGQHAAARTEYATTAAQAGRLGWVDEQDYLAGRAARAGLHHARTLEASGATANAIKLYDELRRDFPAHGPLDVLQGIARSQMDLGAHADAYKAYEKLWTRLRSGKRAMAAMWARLQMSRAKSSEGGDAQVAQALALAREVVSEIDALAATEDEGEARERDLMLARANDAIGVAHFHASDYDDAAEAFQEAYELVGSYKDTDARLLRADYQLNHGMAQLNGEHPRDAKDAFAQANRNLSKLVARLQKNALEESEPAKKAAHQQLLTRATRLQWRARSNLALAHATAGQLAMGLAELLDLRDELRGAPPSMLKAEMYERLGNLYGAIGDRAEALKQFELADEIFRSVGSDAGRSRVASHRGVLARGARQYLQALGHYQEAIKRIGEDGNPDNRAGILMNIGEVQDALANFGEARKNYEAARKLYKSKDNVVGLIRVDANMAELLHHEGKLESARDKLESAGERASDNGDLALAATIEVLRARLELAAGDYKRAIEYADDAIKLHAAGAFAGLADEHGAAARELRQEAFAVGALAAVRSKNASKLFRFMDRGRAGQLLDDLTSNEDDDDSESVRALLRARAEAEREVKSASRALTQAKAQGADEAIKVAEEQVQTALGVQREVEARIAMKRRDPLGDYELGKRLADLKRALQADQTFVMYGLFAEDRGPLDKRFDEAVALVVTKTGDPRVVSLGSASQLRVACRVLSSGALVRTLSARGAMVRREKLEAAKLEWDAEVAKLRALLVTRLELPEGGRILVCPAADLCYLPFPVIFDRPTAFTPSGSAHAVMHKNSSRRKGKGILAIGGPDYTTVSDGDRDIYFGGEQLSDLVHTGPEAESIGSQTLVGAEATESGLIGALPKTSRDRLRALHIACHGRVDPARPSLSSLALTAEPGKNDGFLTVREIKALPPAYVDLVVLSACDTARGDVVRGEGIRGLTRAFMIIGAPRVICALWKVPDASTRALMTKFYELWNPKDGRDGLPVEEALAQAQQYVRSKPEWKHPQHWAAWVLWGLPEKE